ncbi:MAG TPA: M4 family metallopeptidase [Candidatus Nitrosotalea sp.]|nr:M4 family metallopeptidase [Candidatus Nitrosotalea sp.]
MLCIVPPHLLREIINRGDPGLKKWAINTITLSEQVRMQRQTFVSYTVMSVSQQKERRIYDVKNKTGLPGVLVRTEGDLATHDPAVNEAYDGAGWTYDLYKDVYGRNSIDDKGMMLDSSVHYSEKYDNAFWNGVQMVYGDGDGKIFNRFTKAIDVIGHELTHGVTQYTAKLEYQDQSGALNEHISDVFGSIVKQYSLKQNAKQADWLIGQGLFTPQINGVALRSMKAPGTAYDDPLIGKDPQPGNMQDYNDTTEDNGGVHINSGIPNRAFYLIATDIEGYSWDKAGKIWYKTLDLLNANSDFEDMAACTLEAAKTLFGDQSAEQESVRKGWDGVGISIKK